jgi:hypothetical protein
MQIQVNTSNGVENTESLERWAETYLNETFTRFSRDITRIDVQLSDENHSAKSGPADKRCTLEARVTGREPVVAHNYADNQDEAIRGAARKLMHALDHSLGKLRDPKHRERETIRKDADALPDVVPTDTAG